MSDPLLKVATINVQDHVNIERVTAFLDEYKPEVVCMQELFEEDFDYFREKHHYFGKFKPLCVTRFPDNRQNGPFKPRGIAILSLYPIAGSEEINYYLASDELLEVLPEQVEKENRFLLITDIEKNGSLFRIATTHFPKSLRRTQDEPDKDNSDEYQLSVLELFLKKLEKIKDIVLLGDLNAPRGHHVFATLCRYLKDNIPLSYTSSLDPVLHRHGHELNLMVDGFFTSEHYEASDVSLVEGISDHKAVIGFVKRVK